MPAAKIRLVETALYWRARTAIPGGEHENQLPTRAVATQTLRRR